MKNALVLLSILFLVPAALAECVDLNNPDTFGDSVSQLTPTQFVITHNATLCPGTYTVNGGLTVSNQFVTLDCNGATLTGNGSVGIYVGRGASMPYSYNSYITVKNCNIQNYYTGIVVNLAYYTTIEDNNMGNIGATGMIISGVKYNVIRNNRISSGGYNGMTFERSPNGWRTENNEVSGNMIEGFARKGIELNQVDNNTFTGNTIRNNGEYGVYAFNSNGNIIYNNIFENDNNAYSENSNNVWNTELAPGTNIIGGNKLGGNSWSDYFGMDANNDGIGDTPYVIGSSSDSLPLFTPGCHGGVVCPDGSCVDSIEMCPEAQSPADLGPTISLPNTTLKGEIYRDVGGEAPEQDGLVGIAQLIKDLMGAWIEFLRSILGG